MWILRSLIALSLTMVAFFVSLAAFIFLHFWLICLRVGYYETGSWYVWFLIAPGLIPHGIAVWLILKAWRQANLITSITKNEAKRAVEVIYNGK